ncbi:hypothetical protein FOZ60_009504 [Perkinsus olseni]|uniref:Uncharacterized protein n=1 Tax=Perkinsus olseni TaxID=32597 RepID=A0A7J6NH56_PEROL|nr:hypothetical protein FOZ60_009504 [Perkinsus olseni]
MVFSEQLVRLLLLFVVSGATLMGSGHQSEPMPDVRLGNANSDKATKEHYPFTGNYSCRVGMIDTIRVEQDKSGGYITFYRKSKYFLPKPSYGCAFNAHPEWIIWFLDLQDACKALIEDSHGYYDQDILTSTFASVQKRFLVLPNTRRVIQTCHLVDEHAGGAAPEAPPLQRHNVFGVSLDATHPGWSEKKPYPFFGEYSCDSAKIGTIRIEVAPEDNITFYRKSNDSLPKPSYGCGFTAYRGDPFWLLSLQDACKALIRDSDGYFDQKLLTGILALSSGLLTIPTHLHTEKCVVIA